MDSLKHGIDKLLVQAQAFTQGDMVGQDLLPAIHLDNRDVVAFLVFANPCTHFHAASQELQQFIVDIVDLTPKTAQSYYRIRVYIGKTSLKIAKVMVYEKDNTIFTYSIEQFKNDIPLDDKLFVFDKSKYPGVEVNDMR